MMMMIYFSALVLLVAVWLGFLLIKNHIKKITKPYTIITVIDGLTFVVPTPTLELIDNGKLGDAEEIRNNLLSICIDAYNSGWKNDHSEPYVVICIIVVDDSYKVKIKPFACSDGDI